MAAGKKYCPFNEGDTVEWVGDSTYGPKKGHKMVITRICSEGWCSGDIKGDGWHFSQFKAVNGYNNYKIY